MSKEMPLYYIYEDDSGHRYLIPKDEVSTLHEFIDDLLQALDTSHPFYDELYSDNLSGYLEQYDRLEGEEYYVVLASDLNLDKFGLTGDKV